MGEGPSVTHGADTGTPEECVRQSLGEGLELSSRPWAQEEGPQVSETKYVSLRMKTGYAQGWMIQASAGTNPSRRHADSLGQSESGLYCIGPPPCLTLTT